MLSLHSRGQYHNSAGHFRRAESALVRALTELDDDRQAPVNQIGDEEAMRLRARILITRAMSRAAIEGPDSALEVLDEVRHIAHRHGIPMLAVQAHLQAGAIHAMCANWSEALESMAHVAPFFEELAPRELVSAFLVRGFSAMSLSDLDSGRTDLERALDLAVEHDLPVQEFKARHNLGCLAYIAGDIPGALRLLGDAAAMDVGITSARGQLDHAKVLLDAGLVDEAERVLERGLEAARHDRQPLERGEIQLDLARAALLRGDVAVARVRAGHAVRTFRALHADRRTEEVELFGAAVDLGVGRHLTRAAKVAAHWPTTSPVLPAERLATRVRVEVALARHDLIAARTELDRLATDRPQPLGSRLHEHLLASRLATAEGRGERATEILSAAAEQLAFEQGGVHSMEIRAGLAFHAARIRDADVSAATDSGSLPALFESVERWRAASHRAPPLLPPEDEVTAELVARLRQLRRAGDGNPLSSTQREVVVLQSAITDRLRAVRGASGEAQIRSVTFDQTFQLAAERGATIVTFHEIRGTVVRLVIGRDTVRQSVIGPVRDVAAATGRLISDVRAASVARPSMAAFLVRARDSSLREVDTLLLRGLELDGTVVLVPTVSLAALPWRALPSLAANPVVAAPSVTGWVRRAATARREPAVTALSGPGLPRAREEAQAVAKVWGRHTGSPSATTTSGYAGSADVRSALASASVVHLAAHGHHADQSPLFSSLDMADGPVFAHELKAPLAAELVILSACDVGRSRGRPGDEPLGLAAALLGLGVQCVVAATNPVPDDVAASAMVDLHNRLMAGVDVATALRDIADEVEGAEAFCAYGNTWSVGFPPNSPETHASHR
ncbi:MAG: CHAT domain-containing protein [Knoellia sp.]